MITATVLTKNSQKTIRTCLDALKNFPEVIVLDSGSTDDTLKIAESYPNVTIHTSPFLGFGPMHNYATKLASNDWILSIDSDEVVSKELVEELHNLSLNPNKVYSLQRENYYNGRRIKWCAGWHPDHVVRLYNRKVTRFSSDLVHERILHDSLEVAHLKGALLHTPYLEIGDFLEKMQNYTTLFAEQNHGEISSIFHAIVHSWFAFIKSYFFKLGLFGGKEGFIISLYNGHTAFYKYLKLAERASPNSFHRQ